MRRGSLFSCFLQPCCKGLPVSRLAPRAQVLGHKGTHGHFGGLIVIVIVDESLIAAGSRWVHDSFPARSLANVVDVAVAGPQPAGVVEVSVLLEYFLANPLQDLVAAHPRRDGLQTDGLAAQLTLVKAPHRGLLAPPETVMRRAFRRECRLTSRATFFFAQATTFV